MKNRMTIVQALDERELLVKKIRAKMQKAQFVDLMKPKATVTLENRVAKAAFTAQAKSSLQQLEDMIARFDALNEAITYSNASTFLDTSRGRMSVSYAIALRSRLKGKSTYGESADFESMLAQRMEASYRSAQEIQRRKNENTRRADTRRRKTQGNIVILRNEDGPPRSRYIPLEKEDAGAKQPVASRQERQADASQQVVGSLEQEVYVPAQNSGGLQHEADVPAQKAQRGADMLRIVDPLNVRARAEELMEERELFLRELETRIKISNATTYIEV